MNLVVVFLCNIFVDRVKDASVNMLQCEVTEYFVSFLRPQTPYTCVFFISFFVFAWTLSENRQGIYPLNGRSRPEELDPGACDFL